MEETFKKGRPPKPKGRSRTKQAHIPLTMGEMMAFKVAAHHVGLPLAAWMRQACRKEAGLGIVGAGEVREVQ